MQQGGEWLTVKEFAAAAGVTTQAVYKRFNAELTTVYKEENGRRFVHIDALKLFAGEGGLQPSEGGLQPLTTSTEAVALDALRGELDRKAAEIERLQAELGRTRTELTGARLDRERFTAAEKAAEQRAADAIARAEAAEAREKAAHDDAAEQLAAKDRQLSDLAEALRNAQQEAARTLEALTAQQALHAGQIRLAMQEPDQQAGTPADDADSTDADQKPKRRGLLARIFKR